ncbi:7380_t:CDS:2 [Rhizophagus irregularis]|nr:7380_t:CDS:2 [Rhizophagus irregularis]
MEEFCAKVCFQWETKVGDKRPRIFNGPGRLGESIWAEYGSSQVVEVVGSDIY